MAGDSLTIQAFYNGGFGEGAPTDLQVMADNGWTAADVQPEVTAHARAGRPETLVVALGTNDAHPWRGGWTASDVVAFRKLVTTPHADACVVVVTPGYGDGVTLEYAYYLNQARAALRRLVTERPRTVEVDWMAVVQAHPEYLQADGIHLTGEAAWHARSALYWQGLTACRALPPPPTTTAPAPPATTTTAPPVVPRAAAPTSPPPTTTTTSPLPPTSRPPAPPPTGPAPPQGTTTTRPEPSAAPHHQPSALAR